MESKYNLNDRIFTISNYRRTEQVQCPDCEGKGFLISQVNREVGCPGCYGRTTVTAVVCDGWNVSDKVITVGRICMTIRNDDREEEYMCYETGIGSGTSYRIRNIFPTEEEAQAECDRRNLEEE